MAVVHHTQQAGAGRALHPERRELVETAQVFEMIVEANPLEVGALEALREIYVRLGDEARLVRVAEANGAPRPDPRPRGGARGRRRRGRLRHARRPPSPSSRRGSCGSPPRQ